MARPANKELRMAIATVATRILEDNPSTLRLIQDVTDAVHSELFPGRTYNQAYQMVAYYLRKFDRPRKNAGVRYTARVLNHLAIMPTWARSEYAAKRGVSLTALDAAVKRFLDGPKPPVTQNKPYFSFSNPSDLASLGLTREHVVKCREYLDHACGISLRAPNYLYHPLTRKRYALTARDQANLLTDPKRFLKTYADKIKAGWETISQDPLDTPEGNLYRGDLVANKRGNMMLMTKEISQKEVALTSRGRRFIAALEDFLADHKALELNWAQESTLYGVLTRVTAVCNKYINYADEGGL